MQRLHAAACLISRSRSLSSFYIDGRQSVSVLASLTNVQPMAGCLGKPGDDSKLNICMCCIKAPYANLC
jgi:hypothetical protein